MSTPPNSWTGAGRSASSHAASAVPMTGSSVARMAARDGPSRRMPVTKREGRHARADDAGEHDRHQRRARGERLAEAAQRPDDGGHRHVQHRRAAHGEGRRLRCRHVGEAVARGQDIEDLRHGREQRQPDAGEVELAERSGPGDHEGHADEREPERAPAQPIEALAEPDRRDDRDSRRIQVEHQQRQGDPDPLEGDERRQVQDGVRAGRREHEPAVSARQGAQAGRTDAEDRELQADVGRDHRGADRGAPRHERQRVDARIGREAPERPEGARSRPRPGR